MTIKAIIDFDAEGGAAKAGEVITDTTFSADVLMQDLFNAGLIEVIIDGPKPDKKRK